MMLGARGQSRFCTILICVVAVSCAVACAPVQPEESPQVAPLTIVFVHGAWAGGWHYTKVEPLLEAAGHRVYRPTMTGLGERVHLARPEIDLSTHIEDIVNVLEFEALSDVVLVGHSYGGMVIAGVAERVPERISRLVYFDAIVPEDGDSVASLFGDAVGSMATIEGDGDEPWKLVPRWVEEGEPPPVDVPQPLRTFTEPISLGNPEAARLPAAFLLTVEAGRESDDFDRFAERLRLRGGDVVVMEGDHNPQWHQPQAFVEALLRAARPGG